MIATVVSVSEEFTKKGDAYKKVTVVDGEGKQTTKTVFNNLEDKWPLLEDGKTLEFKMEKRGQFWNVVDVKPIETPPAQKPQVLPEHQQVIDEAKPDEPEKPAPAPQAVGMCTKEIGDMIRAKYLKPIFGDEAYVELIKWYRGQIFGITRVPFDGAKLPQFKNE